MSVSSGDAWLVSDMNSESTAGDWSVTRSMTKSISVSSDIAGVGQE